MDQLIKKKLVIVTTTPGTIRYILAGQPEFLSNYFDIVLISSPDTSEERISESEDIVEYRVDMKRGISPFRDLISIFRMIRMFLKIRPDIVHSYTPKAGLVAMSAAWFTRCPIRLHTFTGLIFPARSGSIHIILKLVDSLICFFSTVVIPEGQGVKNDLERYGITKKINPVIGHGNIAGVDIDHFSPAAVTPLKLRDFNVDGSSVFIFSFIGRLNDDKGLKELAEACSVLRGEFRLLIAGVEDQSSPLAPDTMMLLKNNPNVYFLGFLNDIRPLLAVTNVLVLPSYREGFPNVVLQAGAMEVPSIVTDINGSNEIIVDEKNGWIVPVKSTDALSKKMQFVLDSDVGSMKKMGKEARNDVVERFERSAYLGALIEFYSERLRIEK